MARRAGNDSLRDALDDLMRRVERFAEDLSGAVDDARVRFDREVTDEIARLRRDIERVVDSDESERLRRDLDQLLRSRSVKKLERDLRALLDRILPSTQRPSK
ncbi:MAG: hypothetical protein KC466_13715 [Myxococcales bacterium]|nr:hypothetical protein [Myxococcales bacterium]